MQENFQTLIIKKAIVWFEPVLLINTICWDGPFGYIGVRHLCDMYIIKMTDILSMPVISLECQWAVAHALVIVVMGTGTWVWVLVPQK